MYLSTTRTLRFEKICHVFDSLSLSLSLVFFLLLFYFFFSFLRHRSMQDTIHSNSRWCTYTFHEWDFSIVVFSREIFFFFLQLRHEKAANVCYIRIAIRIRCVLNPQSRMKRLLRILIPTRLWDTYIYNNNFRPFHYWKCSLNGLTRDRVFPVVSLTFTAIIDPTREIIYFLSFV